MLEGMWIGSTAFKEVVDFLVDGPSLSSFTRAKRTTAEFHRTLDHSQYVFAHGEQHVWNNFGERQFSHVFGIHRFQPRFCGVSEACSKKKKLSKSTAQLCKFSGAKNFQNPQYSAESHGEIFGKRMSTQLISFGASEPKFCFSECLVVNRQCRSGHWRGRVQTTTTQGGTTFATSCDRHVVWEADRQALA